jgi:hypothetical protein
MIVVCVKIVVVDGSANNVWQRQLLWMVVSIILFAGCFGVKIAGRIGFSFIDRYDAYETACF